METLDLFAPEEERPVEKVKPEVRDFLGLPRGYGLIKYEYPDVILFYKMGSFYEVFEDDARETVKEIKSLVLSGRDKIVLTGFPCHQLEEYLAKMVRAGHRVAVCDTVEEKKTKFKRQVTEII